MEKFYCKNSSLNVNALLEAHRYVLVLFLALLDLLFALL